MCEIYSKLTSKKQINCFTLFIINVEQAAYLVLMFLLYIYKKESASENLFQFLPIGKNKTFSYLKSINRAQSVTA